MPSPLGCHQIKFDNCVFLGTTWSDLERTSTMEYCLFQHVHHCSASDSSGGLCHRFSGGIQLIFRLFWQLQPGRSAVVVAYPEVVEAAMTMPWMLACEVWCCRLLSCRARVCWRSGLFFAGGRGGEGTDLVFSSFIGWRIYHFSLLFDSYSPVGDNGWECTSLKSSVALAHIVAF